MNYGAFVRGGYTTGSMAFESACNVGFRDPGAAPQNATKKVK